MNSIQKLRISLTDACNFRCPYCMPLQPKFQTKAEHLSFEEMLQTVRRLKNILPLKQIRLTGGEPLLRSGVVGFIHELHLMGFTDIGLTTNGFFLKENLLSLKEAGLKSINLSLDSLEAETFYKMARVPASTKAFDKVMDSLVEAKQLGFHVKTNTVVMKGYNDDQIVPILELSKRLDFYPRFLELMSLGEARGYKENLMSMQEMLTVIHHAYGRTKLQHSPTDSTSVNLKAESGIEFGVIASETEPFCQNCSRLRLSADGKLYGCLMKDEGLSIKNCSEEEFKEKVEAAILMKPYYRIYNADTVMHSIGG